MIQFCNNHVSELSYNSDIFNETFWTIGLIYKHGYILDKISEAEVFIFEAVADHLKQEQLRKFYESKAYEDEGSDVDVGIKLDLPWQSELFQ